jgi:uncharacterized membrane protein YfcA
MVAAVLAAWCGALIGARLMPKVTYAAVQRLVAILLAALGILIGAGVI